MRVIAGKFRAHLLKMPKGIKIRPTKDMVKEALFSILGKKISGASFLELFAGSGNVGIEAKSRGADKVYFVENNRICIKTIEANLRRLGIEYSYGVNSHLAKKRLGVVLLPFDAEAAVKALYQKKQKFDLVFLDPPYYQDRLKNSLIKICHYDILRPCSLLIAEHSKREVLPHPIGKLRLRFTKSYGDTTLSFYQKRMVKGEKNSYLSRHL